MLVRPEMGEGDPALYMRPDNFLIDQTSEQGQQGCPLLPHKRSAQACLLLSLR